MDLGRVLFNGQMCSATGEPLTSPIGSLLDQILLGAPRQAGCPADPRLEDAWELAESQAHFQAVYEENAVQESLEAQWRETEAASIEPPTAELPLQQAWEEAHTLEQVWREESAEEELEQAWEEAGAQASEEFWGTFLKQQAKTEYSFFEKNPYLSAPSPLTLSASLEAAGLIPEAILALEAEVRIRPESSEGWRRLGELHAECDNDIQAIAALYTGLKVDPFNLDSLLAIGVSSLNEVRAEDVVKYLGLWLERNPDYAGIRPGEGLEMTVRAFEQACIDSPLDSKAATALGILYLQQRRFAEAEQEFTRALEIEPQSYTLWNKLAAARYMQGEEATTAYERVLELRPSYIRAWANLGSCYWRQGNLQIAARFILCALALGPSDKHLWGKLATMFLLMNRFDLVKKIELQDPYAFSDEFDVVRRESLV